MKTKVTQKDILYLNISIFVIVVAWIGFNLYHTWATTKISEEVQAQVVPIQPVFDTQTINQLKTRQKVAPKTDIKISTKSAGVIPTPTRTVASLSAELTIEPTQTQTTTIQGQ